MDETLLTGIDNALRSNRYSTRTEFIRDAIRTKLSDLEKEEAIRKLAMFKGKLSSAKSDEAAGQVALRKIAEKLNVILD